VHFTNTSNYSEENMILASYFQIVLGVQSGLWVRSVILCPLALLFQIDLRVNRQEIRLFTALASFRKPSRTRTRRRIWLRSAKPPHNLPFRFAKCAISSPIRTTALRLEPPIYPAGYYSPGCGELWASRISKRTRQS
jgi:hypothetical protein